MVVMTRLVTSATSVGLIITWVMRPSPAPCLCEGVEDGLSIALAVPEFRIWCSYSLSNLGNIAVPKCAGKVIVACDNDWGKPGAEAQLARALEALKAQGVPVFEARSPLGKDFNDCLRFTRGR